LKRRRQADKFATFWEDARDTIDLSDSKGHLAGHGDFVNQVGVGPGDLAPTIMAVYGVGILD
jgi:hypothetical protein